jgi:hypothetical protein
MILGSEPTELNFDCDEETLSPTTKSVMDLSAKRLKPAFRLGNRTVPILRVKVPGHDLVVEATQRTEDVAVLTTVGRTKPLGPDTQDLLEGLLQTGDFGLNASGALTGKVFVGPGVRGNLVSRVVCPAK